MAMAPFVLLFLLLASPAVFAKDHTVGGDGGWSQSGDYTTWAAGETFAVGDSLGKVYLINQLVTIIFTRSIIHKSSVCDYQYDQI